MGVLRVEDLIQKDMQSKKRVLQLTNYYYPDVGGIENIAYAITNSLKDQCEIKVICFSHETKDNVIKDDDVIVKRYGTKVKISSQQLSFTMLKDFKHELGDFCPDVVIIHMPNPFLAGILLSNIKKSNPFKLVVYWHSDIIKQRLGEKVFRSMIMTVLKKADVIVATSPDYINGSKYLKIQKDKCVVIPNCIDNKLLQVSQNEMKLANAIREKYQEKIICVAIGRQVPYKGFEYLVDAMKKLDSRYELFLLGRKGESTKTITQKARGMNNIHILGEVDDSYKKAYLTACDIFCFPSVTKNEAFGIALAEAMYYGKPAVTFKIEGSGVSYVNIDGETGIEVENRNVALYAKALMSLAEDYEMRTILGENAKKRVEENFLYHEFMRRIRELVICKLLKM